MALISCPECRAQISDRAWTCPHCGAPNQQRRGAIVRKLASFPIWGFVIAVAILMISLAFSGLTLQSRMEREQREAAQQRADEEWQRLKEMIHRQIAEESAHRELSTTP